MTLWFSKKKSVEEWRNFLFKCALKMNAFLIHLFFAPVILAGYQVTVSALPPAADRKTGWKNTCKERGPWHIKQIIFTLSLMLGQDKELHYDGHYGYHGLPGLLPGGGHWLPETARVRKLYFRNRFIPFPCNWPKQKLLKKLLLLLNFSHIPAIKMFKFNSWCEKMIIFMIVIAKLSQAPV